MINSLPGFILKARLGINYSGLKERKRGAWRCIKI
jgi:hypothetical protein